VLAACVVLATALPALADGDPASDYLIVQSVFAPFDGSVPDAKVTALNELIQTAKARGFRIRVAMIGGPQDLGSVTALWRRPQQYAQFLGQELFYVYKGRLLIVMPTGYGISRSGKPLPAEAKILRTLPTPAAAGSDLGTSAIAAVRHLASPTGVKLAAPKAPKSKASSDRLKILLIAVAVVLIVAITVLPRRRRR
jgi:hypothetical protein